MTQKEKLLELFKSNGNTMTLGQIMQTPLACEYRARMTELRRQGFTILLARGKTPSENRYHIIPPATDGQMAFL